MTKKEKREIIYKAAELIATGEQVFSCCAIDEVQGADQYGPFTQLAHEYASFYGPSPGDWTISLSDYPARDLRILLLLNFAEAGI